MLRAIALHTTGGAGMTQLDKILYLADMIEPNRDFPGVTALTVSYTHLDVYKRQVEFCEVLTVVKDGQVTVGAPVVAGAKVVGKVEKQGKGKKILVFKYKAKANYRRRQGHRQPFTKVLIEKIEA